MPAGVPASLTEEAVNLIEEKALELVAELDAELAEMKAAGDSSISSDKAVDNVLTIIGGTAPKGGPGGGQRARRSSPRAGARHGRAPLLLHFPHLLEAHRSLDMAHDAGLKSTVTAVVAIT